MVQQLIREGNILRRFLNASPMGLMAVEIKTNFTTTRKKLSEIGEITVPTKHNVKVCLHTVNEEVVH